MSVPEWQVNVSEELAEIIREEIRAKGPMPFSHWMELCLYHPQYGYYMKPGRKTGYGRDADFVTPPTLHPFFGRAMGDEIVEAWQIAGEPGVFEVLEIGGGEGDLSLAAVARIDASCPRLAQALRWIHEEESPQHRSVQQARCRDYRFSWSTGSSRRRGDVLVLCEVLDCHPFDVYEARSTGWQEIGVGLAGDAFVEVDGRAGFPDTLARPGNLGDRHPWIAYGPPLYDHIEDELRMPGCVLVCDYGGRGSGFIPGVRAFQRHRAVALVRQDPGEYDITMDVDFSYAPNETRYETMEQFLLRHGILDELNAIDRSTVEGASSYLRLRQLLLPTGMGAAFKVQRFDRAPADSSRPSPAPQDSTNRPSADK